MFSRVRVVPVLSCVWWLGSQLIYLFFLCFRDSLMFLSIILTFLAYWLSIFDQIKTLKESSLIHISKYP